MCFPAQTGELHQRGAIVAAGFPYQPVRSVEDIPACFSRPICRLAMQLNDEVSDEQRQHLLPLVTRLACADTAKMEWEREVFIALHRGVTISSTRSASGFLKARSPLADRLTSLPWRRGEPG